MRKTTNSDRVCIVIGTLGVFASFGLWIHFGEFNHRVGYFLLGSALFLVMGLGDMLLGKNQ